jgi:hypothetical protein
MAADLFRGALAEYNMFELDGFLDPMGHPPASFLYLGYMYV